MNRKKLRNVIVFLSRFSICLPGNHVEIVVKLKLADRFRDEIHTPVLRGVADFECHVGLLRVCVTLWRTIGDSIGQADANQRILVELRVFAVTGLLSTPILRLYRS